jgi:hypothetical protein
MSGGPWIPSHGKLPWPSLSLSSCVDVLHWYGIDLTTWRWKLTLEIYSASAHSERNTKPSSYDVPELSDSMEREGKKKKKKIRRIHHNAISLSVQSFSLTEKVQLAVTG